jgi:2,4-dienoyl-CoA reductase-like NADH-dependent reductase (Old Yellow Enzyme family)
MPTLYDPITIGHTKLENRLVMAPMAFGLSNERGEVTEKLVKHYLERCEGLGLIIIEATCVNGEGRMFEKQLSLADDSNVDALSGLVEQIHSKKVKVAIQLAHAGGTASSRLIGTQPLAPSPIMIPDGGEEVPREMRIDDNDKVVIDFIEAAGRASDAGFDAVELHGAHGYLLNQFLSPITNHRDDEYGGSLANRLRISKRIIEGIKKTNPDLTMLYRLGVEDVIPNGLSLDQGVEAAALLEKMGVDAIDVSGGVGVSLKWIDGQSEVGFLIPQARAVKAAVKVSVIGVGSIKSLDEADLFIRVGSVDLIAVGRSILKNPKWASPMNNRVN